MAGGRVNRDIGGGGVAAGELDTERWREGRGGGRAPAAAGLGDAAATDTGVRVGSLGGVPETDRPGRGGGDATGADDLEEEEVALSSLLGGGGRGGFSAGFERELIRGGGSAGGRLPLYGSQFVFFIGILHDMTMNGLILGVMNISVSPRIPIFRFLHLINACIFRFHSLLF